MFLLKLFIYLLTVSEFICKAYIQKLLTPLTSMYSYTYTHIHGYVQEISLINLPKNF